MTGPSEGPSFVRNPNLACASVLSPGLGSGRWARLARFARPPLAAIGGRPFGPQRRKFPWLMERLWSGRLDELLHAPVALPSERSPRPVLSVSRARANI